MTVCHLWSGIRGRVSMPVTGLSKASVCGLSFAGIAGSNLVGGCYVHILCLSRVVQVAVSVTN